MTSKELNSDPGNLSAVSSYTIRILSPRGPGGCPLLCSGSRPSADGGDTASGWMLPPLPVARRTQGWGSGPSLILLDSLGLSNTRSLGQVPCGAWGNLSRSALFGGWTWQITSDLCCFHHPGSEKMLPVIPRPPGWWNSERLHLQLTIHAVICDNRAWTHGQQPVEKSNHHFCSNQPTS